jgi:PhnB protein
MAFYAYLNFGGNCREAFTRYQEIFGGELVLLGMDAMPSADPVPADQADLVIHAALKIGDALLMASDVMPGQPFGPVQGMYVNYAVEDVDEAKRAFDALADGGDVEMPLDQTFFSPAFGVCKDRFGTPWMISAQADTDS